MSVQRAKGTSFETAVCNFLRPRFIDIRRTGSAAQDCLDLTDCADYAIECKACGKLSPGEWLTQAEAAVKRMAHRYDKHLTPIVIAKRRNKAVGQAYVIMRLEDWREIA